MNKLLLGLALPLALALTLYGTDASAQMGYGMMGSGNGRGSGMMGSGPGPGSGMMGPGHGQQYDQQNAPQYQQPQKPLNENQAREMVENYLQSTRNPNLKLGKIEDKGNAFEANIVTKDGSLVNKILVDKDTGWIHSAY
jgi:hypothetical protein